MSAKASARLPPPKASAAPPSSRQAPVGGASALSVRRRSIAPPSFGANVLHTGLAEARSGAAPALEAWQQGDPTMDTATNLRRRMNLRHEPLVVAALGVWWSTACHSIDSACHRVPLGGAAPRLLRRADYFKMSRKIYKAMIEQWDEADAEAAAVVDWDADRRGAEELDAAAFMDGIFELVDLRTATLL